MKKILFCAVLGCFSQSVLHAQDNKVKNKTIPVKPCKEKPSPLGLESGLDSLSYAIGINIANDLQQRGIEELNLDVMKKGFEDVLKNKPQLLTKEQCGMTLQQKLQEFAQKKSMAMKQKGIDFLNKNKERKEVISLPNGLQYEVLQSGEENGMKPKAVDTVVVDYVGTLIDGKEFDNSIKRGEPATFPLNGVIKGWTEILQLMTKGSKWKVYIPSELGYGDRGAGGTIPPGSVLIFEINLRDIKPAGVNAHNNPE